MSLKVAIGVSQALDGFEAASQASRQALQNRGKASPTLGWMVASYNYPVEGLIQGINSRSGDFPIPGFSTSAGFTPKGVLSRNAKLFLAADGVNGDAAALCDAPPLGDYAESLNQHLLVILLGEK